MSFSEHSCMGFGGPLRVPVITIDGPTASGKGTIARKVAYRLGFHTLDSGALYRMVAWAALAEGLDAQHEDALLEMMDRVTFRFSGEKVIISGQDVTDEIREEAVGLIASRVAALPAVREALVDRQLRFRQPPGLIADGRDMGTVIFPDADLKVFMTASVEVRAQRRYKQLIEKGFPANMASLLEDLHERDQRDLQRAVAPLAPAEGAKVLDTSDMTEEQVVAQVVEWYREIDQRNQL